MTRNCKPLREMLEALEDGELDAREKSRVLGHLASCAECSAARGSSARALGATRSALSQHPRIAAPRGFDARVWQSIQARRAEREQPQAPLARLGLFLLRPIPRLFSSAMFGLLAALAFGHAAVSVRSTGSSQAAIVVPAVAQDADASLSALYAMEQGRLRLLGEPQVLEPQGQVLEPALTPAPQPPRLPQATPERRSQENFLWPSPPRPSRAASSSDAGSWC